MCFCTRRFKPGTSDLAATRGKETFSKWHLLVVLPLLILVRCQSYCQAVFYSTGLVLPLLIRMMRVPGVEELAPLSRDSLFKFLSKCCYRGHKLKHPPFSQARHLNGLQPASPRSGWTPAAAAAGFLPHASSIPYNHEPIPQPPHLQTSSQPSSFILNATTQASTLAHSIPSPNVCASPKFRNALNMMDYIPEFRSTHNQNSSEMDVRICKMNKEQNVTSERRSFKKTHHWMMIAYSACPENA